MLNVRNSMIRHRDVEKTSILLNGDKSDLNIVVYNGSQGKLFESKIPYFRTKTKLLGLH